VLVDRVAAFVDAVADRVAALQRAFGRTPV
jgi:hypothetical protein